MAPKDPHVALNVACMMRRNEAAVLTLLKTFPTAINNNDLYHDSDDHRTALHYAALNGYVEACKALIAAGIDPNIQTDARMRTTPIHEAAMRGHVAVVEVLLQAGVSANLEAADGWRPLHYAAQCNSVPVAQLLLRNGADPDARTHRFNVDASYLSRSIFSGGQRAAVSELMGKGSAVPNPLRCVVL